MASKDGKRLEDVVRQIEEFLVPAGFIVTTNRRVYDEKGVQLAELDIEIVGKVGSADFRGVIECRDRPSEGPAPVAWIEQLIGRRNRLKLDKVMAVSTTGFSEAARAAAQQAGIELRVLQDVSPASLSSWLQMEYMTQLKRVSRLAGIFLAISDAEEPAAMEALKRWTTARREDKKFTLVASANGNIVSADEAFLHACSQNDETFDGLEPNGPSRSVELRVNYTNDADHYIVVTDIGPVRIRTIVFRGDVSVIESHIPLGYASEYRAEDKSEYIAQVAGFPLEISGSDFAIEFHRVESNGETHIVLRKK